MTWNEVLMSIIETLFRIIIIAGVPYLFAMLRNVVKKDYQIKYLNMLEEMIHQAVAEVQQTYVENLKAADLFNADAQRNALNMAKDAVLKMMNDKTKKIVMEAVGDFDSYLTTKIEAAVHDNKMLTGPLPILSESEVD